MLNVQLKRSPRQNVQIVSLLTFLMSGLMLVQSTWPICLSVTEMAESRGLNFASDIKVSSCDSLNLNGAFRCDNVEDTCFTCSQKAYPSVGYRYGYTYPPSFGTSPLCGNQTLGTCNANFQCVPDVDPDPNNPCQEPSNPPYSQGHA